MWTDSRSKSHAHLILHVQVEEGVHAHEVMHNSADRGGVVMAVQELRNAGVSKGFKAGPKLLQPAVSQRADGSRQVPKRCRASCVQPRGGVIRNDPRKHGVLRQITERPAGQRVQMHQVLKVGHAALSPCGCYVGSPCEDVRGRHTRRLHLPRNTGWQHSKNGFNNSIA
jgi:hypothetical protein